MYFSKIRMISDDDITNQSVTFSMPHTKREEDLNEKRKLFEILLESTFILIFSCLKTK